MFNKIYVKEACKWIGQAPTGRVKRVQEGKYCGVKQEHGESNRMETGHVEHEKEHGGAGRWG